MSRPNVGNPRGRPRIYNDDNRPVRISLWVPHDLATEMKNYVKSNRRTMTALLLEGLSLRLNRENDVEEMS